MFTNNLCENINRFLNSNLKRGICSNFLFRASILSIFINIKIKQLMNLQKKKSEILAFYINNYEEPHILNNKEIYNLKII